VDHGHHEHEEEKEKEEGLVEQMRRKEELLLF
jgi:hypothetical protein